MTDEQAAEQRLAEIRDKVKRLSISAIDIYWLLARLDAERAGRANDRETMLDVVDCLTRVLSVGQPFTLDQREEVRLAIESLNRALAAAGTDAREAGDA